MSRVTAQKPAAAAKKGPSVAVKKADTTSSGSEESSESEDEYYFEDIYDLVKFIKSVQQGVPSLAEICLRNRFSKENEPFKVTMQKIIEKIVSMIKAEKLFQTQGGPIILTQVKKPVDF